MIYLLYYYVIREILNNVRQRTTYRTGSRVFVTDDDSMPLTVSFGKIMFSNDVREKMYNLSNSTFNNCNKCIKNKKIP